MTKKRGGLGRGLGALIPTGPGVEETTTTEQSGISTPVAPDHPQATTQPVEGGGSISGLLEVPVRNITPNPHQPRHAIKEETLEELAASIREHGLLQPLLVTGAANGMYSLIAGERRWRAAQLVGLERVPILVKEASSREMIELALVENLQRADLNPLEEARAYQQLLDDFGLKQEDIAARVGKSRGAVANSLRLLKLPPSVLEALAKGELTEGHARAILQAPTEEEQVRLLNIALANGLNVRQVEQLARRMEATSHHVDELQEGPDDLYDEVRALEDRFRDALGTKVNFSRSSRGGKLTIYFYSDEELNRIYETIVGDGE